MKASETSSERSSGATSTSGPNKRGDDSGVEQDHGRDAHATTESQYLAAQAADARLAMDQTLADLKRSLTGTVDVRLWTRQFPWIATALAAGGGVAAGYFLTPRDRDEAREMWEKLKEKFTSAKRDRDT